jgi:hypothetical protein
MELWNYLLAGLGNLSGLPRNRPARWDWLWWLLDASGHLNHALSEAARLVRPQPKKAQNMQRNSAVL